jgi:hypothetical protein
LTPILSADLLVAMGEAQLTKPAPMRKRRVVEQMRKR